MLCVAALLGLNKHGAGANKLIGRAFGVAERRFVSIHTDKIEQLPISHQKTVKESCYDGAHCELGD
jgi:hypothetical protein